MRFHPVTLGLAVLALAMLASLGGANTATASEVWTTPTGSTVTDGSVNAQATFTFNGSGGLNIVLENLKTNIVSGGQAVSGIYFTLDPSSTLALASSSAQHIDVSGTGVITSLGTYSTGWEVKTPTTTLWTLVGQKPDEMIIGPDSGGSYSSINNGAQQHNPFLYEAATFNLTGVSTDPSVHVGTVTFMFGTVPAYVGGIAAAPEPASFAMAGTAVVVGLGIALRRRRRAMI